MLIGMVLGALAGWQVVHASQSGELMQFLSPASTGWALVAGLTVVLFVVALAMPSFARAFAPWLVASGAWAARDALGARDVTTFWCFVMFALAMLAVFLVARAQRVVPRRPRTNSARVVRSYLRAYDAR